MGWTKRQLIEQAFEEIGYAAYQYDLTPDQLRSGLRRMDSMLATWAATKGINLGYPITNLPQDSDLDTQTNVPAHSNAAIYQNLAILLAPSIGKAIPIELKAAAHSSYNALLSLAAMPNEMQMPGTMPAGAGNKPWNQDRPFLKTPDTSPIRLGDNGQLIFTE